MIEKKSFGNVIKRAMQTGTFNYVGQESKEVPPELFRLEDLPLEEQNWWDCVAITKMDFSNNEIAAVPDKLTLFTDLAQLRMKNNALTALPPCLATLKMLKLLDLSRNRIPAVPKEYALCPALVELNLAENALVYLPDLAEVRSLEVLQINDNRLRELPVLGEGMRKVEASSNAFTEIPAEVFRRCAKLETLALNKNQIERIEKGAFSQTRSLVLLELKENRIANFSEMPWSERLDTIALSFNRLTEFSDFDKCPNLSVLTLSDNKIKRISGDIVKLQKLKTLDLSNNDLPDLPSELGFVDGLVRLQVEGNPLKAIRQNIRAGGVNAIKKYLKDRMDPNQRQNLEKKLVPSSEVTPHEFWVKLLQEFTLNGELVLRNMNIDQLHEVVFERDLKVLNVTGNKIASIPESIERLQNLKALVVSSNELSKLPDSVSELPFLEAIEAQHNKLTDFVFFRKPFFASLLHLDLSTNRLAKVPESVLKVPKLRTLHLSYNKIGSIELLLFEDCLPFLQILDVSNNVIDDVSDYIFRKQSLNYLNLENNNLTRLPTVLGFMKLMGLKVDGNPLKLIKRQVIEKGTVVLMEFLRTKHQGDPPVKPNRPVFKQEVQENNNAYEEVRRENGQQPRQEQRYPREANQAPKQSNQQKEAQVQALEKEIRAIEQQLQNGMGLNNWQKTEKKKKMQSLMIQRNKLLKQ